MPDTGHPTHHRDCPSPHLNSAVARRYWYVHSPQVLLPSILCYPPYPNSVAFCPWTAGSQWNAETHRLNERGTGSTYSPDTAPGCCVFQIRVPPPMQPPTCTDRLYYDHDHDSSKIQHSPQYAILQANPSSKLYPKTQISDNPKQSPPAPVTSTSTSYLRLQLSSPFPLQPPSTTSTYSPSPPYPAIIIRVYV
ncbi:hypothetical protein K439DRAFT_1620991 [Ramaria rubella]|nr:hypothetical protein K439DRAFT_1620991 [Ramaria rubella]